ncbi:hypothetical protein ASG56_06090 [Rhodococcus sp. Leaf7]|nr:hypothetical protein ASG56_06090 [Rhodococcus sp. Leaf7]KQU42632.1 hypothetical protein ASG64_06090 [Rhodococcus sp. Leaf247]
MTDAYPARVQSGCDLFRFHFYSNTKQHRVARRFSEGASDLVSIGVTSRPPSVGARSMFVRGQPSHARYRDRRQF